MFKVLVSSFLLALGNIRARFFHTLLSVLGIVIGVASLVSILSLIDGMEKFASDQISQTTSLNAIMVRTEQYRQVKRMRIKKDTLAVMDYDHYLKLKSSLTLPAEMYLRGSYASEVLLKNPNKISGSAVIYATSPPSRDAETDPGRLFTIEELNAQQHVAVVNRAFMRSLELGRDSLQIVGKTIAVKGVEFKVIGLFKSDLIKTPIVCLPFTLLTISDLKANPPETIIEAKSITDVKALKEQAETWLSTNYPGKENFSVVTNESRVEQAAKAFFVFRIVMGLIVGISVLVGGIGVMNVLLISVNERTVEIGLRKAVGANRRDIMLQFLSESITVAAFGSILGVIVGVSMTMIAIPIIKALTEAPFQAAYTANTMITISIVALLVGIVFGTYPAMRASRLDPVEAMRHE